MIKIQKSREPSALASYRQTPFASYDGMHGAKTGRVLPGGTEEDVYHAVLNSLMKEQGHLCAYCMRRIPEKRGYPAVTIEHIDPQSQSSVEKGLNYQNMLAVCSGNRNAKSLEEKTCDARRGNAALSINPLKAATLAFIDYRASGRIYSKNPKIDDELNKTLNLNCAARDLIRARKSALNAMLKYIDEKGWQGNENKYSELLTYYQSETDVKTEYVGILINWLKRHT